MYAETSTIELREQIDARASIKGYSKYEDLAKVIGVTPQALSQVLTGKTKVNDKYARKFSEYLGETEEYWKQKKIHMNMKEDFEKKIKLENSPKCIMSINGKDGLVYNIMENEDPEKIRELINIIQDSYKKYLCTNNTIKNDI